MHSWQAASQRRPRRARTEENVETVNDLVLSQEDKPLQMQTFYQNHVLVAENHVDYWQILQLEAIKMQFAAFFSIYAKYLQKIWFSISLGSVATCLR